MAYMHKASKGHNSDPSYLSSERIDDVDTGGDGLHEH